MHRKRPKIDVNPASKDDSTVDHKVEEYGTIDRHVGLMGGKYLFSGIDNDTQHLSINDY